MLSTIFISLHTIASLAFTDTSRYELLVGSYTKEGNPGIEIFDANINSGSTSPLYTLKNANASYLTVSADGKYMFSVAEEGAGKSAMSAYQLNEKGRYEFINAAPTIGNGPCFVAYREATKTVYAANYGSGSLSVFKTENGRLGSIAQHIEYKGSSIDKSRQQAPHAHNVVISPDQHYLYVVDLGTDKIHQHKIYADGLVDEKDNAIAITPGNGPRHLTLNPSGTHAYLINEMAGVVDVFRVDNNRFTLLQTLPADTAKTTPHGSADIHISPNGKWLLTSNRVTSNELTVFAIQPDGTLKGGDHYAVAKKPRNFSFDPSGKFVFVASQEEKRVQVFSFDDNNGRVSDTKQDIPVSMPVCLIFVKRDVEMDAEVQIKKNNITLIPPTAPIANYVKYVQVGKMVFLSGHGPDKPGGGQVYGKLGKDLSLEEGQAAARLTGISLLSTLKGLVGDLNKVKRIVKLVALVNSTDTFVQQPLVVNGCSNLMVEVFGDRGKHARTSVGVNALPNNIAVEIEMIVELK